MSQNLTQQALRGAGWILGGNLLRLLIRMIIVAMYARLLDPEDYGIAIIAFLFVELSISVSQFGLSSRIIQMSNLEERHISTAIYIALVVSVLFLCSLFYLAESIAELFAIPELRLSIQILAFTSPLVAINGIFEAILARNGDAKSIARRAPVSFFLSSIFIGLPAAYIGLGYWSLILQLMFEILISSVFLTYHVRHFIPKLRFSMKASADLAKSSVGFGLIDVLTFASANIEKFIIAGQIDAYSFGLYSRAVFILNTSRVLFETMARNSFFPAVSKIQDDLLRVRHGYLNALAIISLITFPGSIFLSLYSSVIIDVLFGAGWEGVAEPFAILALTVNFRIVATLSTILLQSQNISKSIIFLKFFSVSFIGIGSFLFAQHGLTAVCYIILIATLLEYSFSLHLSFKVLRATFDQYILIQIAPVINAIIIFIFVFSFENYEIFNINPILTLLISLFFIIVILLLLSIIAPLVFVGDRVLSFFVQFFGRKDIARTSSFRLW